jgi:hypothetical protein
MRLASRPFMLTNPICVQKHDTAFTIRFECVRDIDGIALLVTHRGTIDMSFAGLDRPTVDNNRRAIMPCRGDRAARHVLVTSGQGYVTVVVLGLERQQVSHVSTCRTAQVDVLMIVQR